MDFSDYYQSLGLLKYPFTTYTTEHETAHAAELFVPMTEYGPIQEAFRSGQNMIILGERGVGKTAVLEEFHRNVPKGQVYSVVNSFTEMQTASTSQQYYKLILKNLLLAFVKHLRVHPLLPRRLTKRDRVLLSYLIYYYSDNLTLESMKDSLLNIQIPLSKRIAAAIFNRARLPINYAGTVLENALKRYIAQILGAVPFLHESAIVEYFPEIHLKTEQEFIPDVDCFRLIQWLSEAITNTTRQKPIVVFDKLDEDQRLSNDAEMISEFLRPLLSDNSFLSLDTLQAILFVWKTPFRYIESHVRSQKYFCPTIKWNNEALKRVLDRRLVFYSEGKLSDHRALFENPTDVLVEELFDLANGVPRDLWHILNKVFEEQFRCNPHSRFLEKSAIDVAKERFVTEFNYYEYYPRKANARRDSMDVYSYYAHLRKVGAEDFSKTQFNDRAGTGSSTSNYLIGMERIGLIEKIRQERGELIFRIRDSKITYAIGRNIDLKTEI